jgi:hypothetical protein
MCVILCALACFWRFLPAFLSRTPPRGVPRKKYIIKVVGLWRAQFTYFLFLSFYVSPSKLSTYNFSRKSCINT